MPLEKPQIEDEAIAACLSSSYGLAVSEIEFLPLGYDMNAAVYRVRAGGQSYFLKVKSDAVDELSLILPRYLRQQGIEQVVAPLPTTTRDPWGRVDLFTLLLYPFIEEKERNLSDAHWIEFGAVLKRLHETQLSPELLGRLPMDNFIPPPKWTALMRRLQAEVGSRAYSNPIEQQAAALWQKWCPEIALIVERAGLLGRMLQDKSLDFVICHADIHTGNLMLDRHDNLFIVDWDEPVLAPKERDLMFVTVGGFVKEARQEELFFQGYGKTDIDPLVMAYYRYERVMEDIAGFGEPVFLMDTTGETKQDSLKWLTIIFGPGGDVEAAHKLDGASGL